MKNVFRLLMVSLMTVSLANAQQEMMKGKEMMEKSCEKSCSGKDMKSCSKKQKSCCKDSKKSCLEKDMKSCSQKGKSCCKDSKKSCSSSSKNNTIYSYKVKDITGKTFDFSSLMGKKVMIVNTASKCGLTPQYKSLEALYQKYKDRNFVIIGFPSDSFEQEPADGKEILQFCEMNYGVTFPLMDKIEVKGKKIHPLYAFLTKKTLNNVQDSEVEWNFQKYLINKEGKLEKVFAPKIMPDSAEIIKWIEN